MLLRFLWSKITSGVPALDVIAMDVRDNHSSLVWSDQVQIKSLIKVKKKKKMVYCHEMSTLSSFLKLKSTAVSHSESEMAMLLNTLLLEVTLILKTDTLTPLPFAFWVANALLRNTVTFTQR